MDEFFFKRIHLFFADWNFLSYIIYSLNKKGKIILFYTNLTKSNCSFNLLHIPPKNIVLPKFIRKDYIRTSV